MTDYFLDFGDAFKCVKSGKKVARNSWIGKSNNYNNFIFMVPGSNFLVNRPPLLGIYPEGTEIHYLPHVDRRWLDGTISPWTPSQADLFATDWVIVDD